MRFIFLNILIAIFITTGCERKPEKVMHRIGYHRVFAVKDPVDSSKLPKVIPDRLKDTSYIEYVFKAYDLVSIKTMDSSIHVNLKYADTNNFLKKNIYDGLRKAYFTCEMAISVCAAQHYLKQINPDYSLVIFDASRPLHIQQLMWDSLKMPAIHKFNYLSKPQETSLHNYGCAVDASIIDTKTGEELDMGTDYDTFSKLSQPLLEAHYLKTGELTREEFKNRRLLRMVMKKAGLHPINSEWWHFGLVSKEEAMERFALIK